MKYLLFIIVLLIVPAMIYSQETEDIAAVLVNDGPTSQTIIGAQSLTETDLAEIRLTMNGQSSSDIMNENLDQLITSLANFISATEARLPEQQELLRSLGARSQTLINNLKSDYLDQDNQQAELSFNLLTRAWEELKSVPAAANITGLRTTSALIPEPPLDWDKDQAGVGFGSRWTLRTGKEISGVLRSQLLLAQKSSRINLKEEHLEKAQDIRQLSQLLRDRTGELPAISRKGFLDIALQLEVISDNLEYYYNSGNQIAYRRQLSLAIQSVDRLRDFYSVRNSDR